MASHHEFIGHYQLQILKNVFFCYFMFKFVNDVVMHTDANFNCSLNFASSSVVNKSSPRLIDCFDSQISSYRLSHFVHSC